MKKTYMNPTMKVVKIQTRMILANSLTGVGFNKDAETGTMDSRVFDFDDEE